MVEQPGALGRIIPTLTRDDGPGYRLVAACSTTDEESLLGVPVVGPEISGRSDLSWEDAVRLDLSYVESWSVTFDLPILVRTVKAVLRQRGAS